MKQNTGVMYSHLLHVEGSTAIQGGEKKFNIQCWPIVCSNRKKTKELQPIFHSTFKDKFQMNHNLNLKGNTLKTHRRWPL